MAKKDFYDVLGIKKGASDDEVNKAYRQKAKQFHPDISKEENAEEKFKEVQEAYETLNDPEKRDSYDRFGHQANNGGFGGGGQGFGGFEGFGGFGDIFGDIFGGGASRGQTRTYDGPERGADLQRVMSITFMEAVLGTKKTVKIDIEEDCETCNGTGAKSPKDIHECKQCHGQGYINVNQRTMFGDVRTQQVCPTCGGEGTTIDHKCETCRGSGRVRKSKNVEVNIPAGITNNMTLRVAGYGDGGKKGGAHGDLLLTFRVKPHKLFKRNGDDIILEVPITFTDAALGTTVDVPTIYGEVSLKIPAGIAHGTSLRMREKGVASVRTKRKGDQHVVVELQTPKNLTARQKELFDELGKLETKEKTNVWQKFKNIFKAD